MLVYRRPKEKEGEKNLDLSRLHSFPAGIVILSAKRARITNTGPTPS